LIPNLNRRLHHVQDPKLRIFYRNVLKSLPLMRCQIGNFYHMESEAKLTMLHTVIDWLVALLVSF
jgi:hypothetical protein